jgi:hypothetical protein
MGGEATVIGEAQLREMMGRLSVLHDQHAELSEKIMTTISEGEDRNTREDLHRRRQQCWSEIEQTLDHGGEQLQHARLDSVTAMHLMQDVTFEELEASP